MYIVCIYIYIYIHTYIYITQQFHPAPPRQLFLHRAVVFGGFTERSDPRRELDARSLGGGSPDAGAPPRPSSNARIGHTSIYFPFEEIRLAGPSVTKPKRHFACPVFTRRTFLEGSGAGPSVTRVLLFLRHLNSKRVVFFSVRVFLWPKKAIVLCLLTTTFSLFSFLRFPIYIHYYIYLEKCAKHMYFDERNQNLKKHYKRRKTMPAFGVNIRRAHLENALLPGESNETLPRRTEELRRRPGDAGRVSV